MSIAAASFGTAAALAFVALIISPEHEIAAGVCMVIAQFLTLTATILGINYKFSVYEKINATSGHPQQ